MQKDDIFPHTFYKYLQFLFIAFNILVDSFHSSAWYQCNYIVPSSLSNNNLKQQFFKIKLFVLSNFSMSTLFVKLMSAALKRKGFKISKFLSCLYYFFPMHKCEMQRTPKNNLCNKILKLSTFKIILCVKYLRVNQILCI